LVSGTPWAVQASPNRLTGSRIWGTSTR